MDHHHHDPVNDPPPRAGRGPALKDPICGMDVDPASALNAVGPDGDTYFFCSRHCLDVFRAGGPARAPGTHARQGPLIGIGRAPSAKPTAIDPICGMTVDPATALSAAGPDGTTFYFCSPRCKEKFLAAGPPAPSGSPSRSGAPSAGRASPIPGRYTCPMHPEIVKNGPGSCPICGMALEPVAVRLEEESNPELADMSRRFRIGLVLTAPVFLLGMSEMIPGQPLHHALGASLIAWVQLVLATPVVLWAGWPFFERGYASVVNRSPNMFTLISMGTGAAYAYSAAATVAPGAFPDGFRAHGGGVAVYFESAAVITVLVLLGQVLELRARGRTSDAIRALLRLAPKRSRRVNDDGTEEEIPTSELRAGDRVRIRPGEKIPVDGVVTDGRSAVDESLVTGEPIPVEKTPGSPLTAGTLNGTGALVMRAERVGEETLLAQIVRMVSEAQRSRAPIQRLADAVSAWFVPAVVVVALITFAVWAVAGPEPRMAFALLAAVAVLIIACPCALGLATPMSIMVGTGRGATAGVLIRNAEALELLERVDTLVVDKTGTLTEGKPRLVSIVRGDVAPRDGGATGRGAGVAAGAAHVSPGTGSSLPDTGHAHPAPGPEAHATMGGSARTLLPGVHVEETGSALGEDDLLRLAASLERGSEHPLAAAIVSGAEARRLQLGQPAEFRSITGKGVVGRVEGRKVALGNQALLDEMGIDPGPLAARAGEARREGQTIVFLAVDGRPAGLLGVADPIKASTPEAIRMLHADGVRIVMLTGDARATAEAVARTLGIDEVVAEVLPDQKSEIVARLQKEGRIVAMAGDGVNDAPALARAHVGIAMGTGTDVAMESAGVTLVKGDLRGIARARRLSRATMRNIRLNLLLAFGYNTLAVPLAAGVLYPFFGLLLSPMIASAAMSLSSVSVIANALRLRRAAL